MNKGMLFDLYREDQETRRVMAISKTDVVDLNTLEVIKNVDFENEVEEILIDDILTYPYF